MSDLDSWLKEATPHHHTVRVCFDRNLIAEWEEATEELKEASKGMLQPPKELKQRVDDLVEKVQEATKEFVFQSIGHRPWRRLLAEHPPTKEQRQDLRLDHNPETLMPVAMAATCKEPEMTVDQAEKILETQPVQVVDRLWSGVVAANVIGGDEKKVVATDAHQSSEQK